MQEHIRDVAVVGTGMAGLVTAYLLHHDPQQRFRVRLIDKNSRPSLAAESIALPVASKHATWADVPMRAFAGGFYHNLVRMYDYLDIDYHQQPFLFNFVRLLPPLKGRPGHTPTSPAPLEPYMIHASNFHQWPPLLRGDMFQWSMEVAMVLICYLWFTLCCFLVAPAQSSNGEGESLNAYLQRIRLPQAYITRYLLPMISSVSTCTHAEMLRFPASDVLAYKRQTHRQPHFVVTDGVHTVQEKLLRGIDVRLGVESTRVVSAAHDDGSLLTTCVDGSESTERFDLIVLAVAPDAAARIFEPLRTQMQHVPMTMVQTVAHTDSTNLVRAGTSKHHAASGDAVTTQQIYLCTNEDTTEAVHVQPNSLLVTTNPLTPIDPSKIIRSARFPRVLRNPTSQLLINKISEGRADKGWNNGDDGVYLAGGWCWDGMVLLEGCVVSAMRIARDLGVDVPWK
ncbi:hypothetical protein PENANT_c027G00970 [Penicillium antarcticum]|uniref:Amine oxidase domain-containing protein n=1 Tax=Penicillium antarcticum TaxID=416450 RepID=A0A1V6PWR2_9EURO|nr:uncharacterized protein N7508_003331 [Penicillium antarcticum]KAJ5312501.1 hypothetical protein N7508_003331 [Penicillium antarcticum]OQD81454.1 hypothetical protein PENANT_c027G00970 [Penicillium antarcticum]